MDRNEVIEVAEYLKEQLGPVADQVIEAATASVVITNIIAWVVAGLLLVAAIALWLSRDTDLIGFGFAAFVLFLIVGGVALHDVVAREWVVIVKMLRLVPGL